MVSASVLAQIRHAAPAISRPAAIFDGSGMLLRPEQYRDWILAGGVLRPHHSAGDRSAQDRRPESSASVYINPAAYEEYARTGSFPEGTVMVLETAAGANNGSVLLASVKDRARFTEGWGFFDFTGADGIVKSAAQALPGPSDCRSCHGKLGRSDHVFTQFYPALRSSLQESALPMRKAPAITTEFS
jgi:hypothetical protein